MMELKNHYLANTRLVTIADKNQKLLLKSVDESVMKNRNLT